MTVLYIVIDFVIVFAIFALIFFLKHLIQTRRHKHFSNKELGRFRNTKLYDETMLEQARMAPVSSSFLNVDERDDTLPREATLKDRISRTTETYPSNAEEMVYAHLANDQMVTASNMNTVEMNTANLNTVNMVNF